MKRQGRWLKSIIVCACLACTGCASAYKQVVFKASDKATGEAMSGIKVQTDYAHLKALIFSEPEPDFAVTDERGIAVLSAKCKKGMYGPFGIVLRKEVHPCFWVTTTNEPYDQALVSWWHPDETVFSRQRGFVPTNPDVEFKSWNKAEIESHRRMVIEKQRALNAALDAHIREHPEYWPPESHGHIAKTAGVIDATLVSRRWELASTNCLGSTADLIQIRAAIKKELLSRPDVGEIRWVSADCVVAEGSWYSGPQAAAGYHFVVRKEAEVWKVIARYMLWIS